MRAREEPSLYSLRKNLTAESYRFLWLRTFHHPIAIRLDLNSDGTSNLIVKVASGAGGYSPGVLREQRSQMVGMKQTQAFLKRIGELRFWNTPSRVSDEEGADGSQWIIEGLHAGRYHVLDRSSPSKGAVRKLGMMLAFDLAKMDIPEDEIY